MSSSVDKLVLDGLGCNYWSIECVGGKSRHRQHKGLNILENFQSQQRVVVASGYFAPIHKGHLRYLHEAAKLSDMLFVVVNSDIQTRLKGSTPFMDEFERLEVVRSLRCVDAALLSIDTDRSIAKTLELLHRLFGVDILTNGGDVRDPSECREAEVCNRLGIKMVFGVGGYDKIQSSSDLIRRSIQT